MNDTRAAKRSESHRVRQVNRYLGAWREVQDLLYGPPSPRSLATSTIIDAKSIPRASSDKALTAFAQLATLRLNVTRAVISLIDNDTQYILAEATQTISLMNDSRHDQGDQLAFGKLNIPRSESICCRAFGSSTTVSDPSGRDLSVNAFVLHDALEDQHYKNNPIIRQQQIKFFASVPIVTLEGVKIGAYSVMSTESRGDPTFSEFQFLQDVSSTVFEHLVLVRDRLNSVRGARMVNGLTNFIGRSETLEPDTLEVGSVDDEVRKDESTNQMSESEVDTPMSADEASQNRWPKSYRTQIPDTRNVLHSYVHGQSSGQLPLHQSRSTSPVSTAPSTLTTIDGDLKIMFDQAAKSLQNCTNANGCIFLEATMDNNQTNEFNTHERGQNNVQFRKNTLTVPFSSKDERSDGSVDSVHETQSESDASNLSDQNDGSVKVSSILGSSFHLQGKVQGETGFPTFSCTEQDLRRCIRRYPDGKIFNFTNEGTISSGEDTLSDRSQRSSKNESKPDQTPTTMPQKRSRDPTRVRKFVAGELIKIIPGVKSVIFLPLWDFSQSRWYAGLFLWTTEIGRLMDTNDEFPYIRAFGNTIMNEVSRLTAVHSERAKTTFIASISHELRSPLHGILGSVEFMSDTQLDSFQRGLVHSVEICGKTLLDTIDHVLDYAKINYFGLLESRTAKTKRKRSNRLQAGLVSHTNRTSTFNICTLVEEVIEAVYAGQTFKHSKSGLSADTFDEHTVIRTRSADLRQEHSNSAPPIEYSKRFSSGMTVILDIDTNIDAIIVSQPGALRRVVMNLFGNALKYSYTAKGLIRVTLRRSTQTSQSISGHLPVELLISDTGRGMSADYLRHKLYRPFSQEDPFSVGTGLGLSIVRQIITSLKGKIQIKSEQGRGTDISVNLWLPTVDATNDHEQKHFSKSLLKMTEGLRICILDSGDRGSIAEPSRSSMINALSKTLKTWFGMFVSTAQTADQTEADFYICPEAPSIGTLQKILKESVKLKSAPLIVVCTDAFEKAKLKTSGMDRLSRFGPVVEVISQPCGPSKMAQALESCFRSLHTKSTSVQRTPEADRIASKPAINDDDDLNHIELAATADYDPKTSLQLELKTPTPVIASRAMTPGSRMEDLRRQGTSDIDNYFQLQDYSSTSPDPLITPSLEQTLNAKQLGLNVLLVDDNTVNLRLLVAFITKLSLPFTSASNGREAFEAYQQQYNAGRPFSHILMDINMPVMDGMTSTKEIRHFERQHGIRRAMIAALTGMAGQSIQEEAVQAGFDHYFSKPVRFKELKRLVLGD